MNEDGPSATTRSRHIGAFAVALVIGTLLGLTESVKGYWVGRTAPNDFGWLNALAGNLPWWIVWALLSLLIFRLVDRWPLHYRTLKRAVPLHLAVSLLLSAFHLGLSAFIAWGANVRTLVPFQSVLTEFTVGYFVTDQITYWAIVAGYSAYSWREALRSAEREQYSLELRAARAETETARLEEQMTEARLAALRMELNPHFLFNTLNSVSALAQKGEAGRASQVLTHLSALLRRTLRADLEHEVRLDEELDVLEGYLAIERVRFGDRLTIQVSVDPSVRAALVPTFLLQPLVENAMRHGVEAQRGDVSLTIHARASDRGLMISVGDSGRAFSRSQTYTEGIGLGNTRARLDALYGSDARLEIGGDAEGRTRVQVALPLRYESPIRVNA